MRSAAKWSCLPWNMNNFPESKGLICQIKTAGRFVRHTKSETLPPPQAFLIFSQRKVRLEDSLRFGLIIILFTIARFICLVVVFRLSSF